MVAASVLNVVEPGQYYDSGISIPSSLFRSAENGGYNPEYVDRVKKAFPNYVDEVDQLFTKRAHQLDNITFSTLGKLGDLDTATLATHEFTHAMRQVAEQFSQVGENIFGAEEAIQNFHSFREQVRGQLYDTSAEVIELKQKKLLKVGEEALDISTYSKRLENELFNALVSNAAEEARANTGANLLTRMAFGKEASTQLDDMYVALGGFRGYLDTNYYAETLLKEHPFFSAQEVEVGDRGLRVMKPMEEFPELLEQFGKTKKEISLRVDMRLNAEYLGQLGELGGGYSGFGEKNIHQVMMKNAQDVFDRAYAIDGDLEKAYGYIAEYGDMIDKVSQEARGVSTISISTMPEIGELVRTKNSTRCK
jgi:hypothetical protein